MNDVLASLDRFDPKKKGPVMKYLKEEYRTKGFVHTLIKRYEDIYFYKKVDSVSGRFVCFEIFKARKRCKSPIRTITSKNDDHPPAIDEDFGYRAFSITDES